MFCWPEVGQLSEKRFSLGLMQGLLVTQVTSSACALIERSY